MKKLFLLVAFTGIVGASSALSVVALAKGTVITLQGDEKKDEKKKCDKNKSCCKKGGASKGCAGEKAEAKGCSHGDAKKSCSHDQKAPVTNITPATPTTK